MKERELKVGEIMQLHPTLTRNHAFRGCMFVVSDPKVFGAQGYVQGLGSRDETAGQAYYRASWEEMEETGGIAPWVVP
jgi:hypothetical protein